MTVVHCSDLAAFRRYLEKHQHSIPAPARPFATVLRYQIKQYLKGDFGSDFPKLFGDQLARFEAARVSNGER